MILIALFWTVVSHAQFGQTYNISGTYNLPTGYYQNCTFNCAPGSIILGSASISGFSGCLFQGTNGNSLWEGIFVPNGGDYYFSECKFKNAITAIKGYNGSSITARSCKFEDNKFGIFMLETPNGEYSTSRLSSNYNEFYGINGIDDAFVGNKPLAGIVVYDMVSPNITDANYFHEIQNGILMYHSNLYLYNFFWQNSGVLKSNIYKNIQPAQGNQFADEQGVGLLIDGGSAGNANVWLDGSSNFIAPSFGINTQYNFDNCKVGVRSINANIYLNSNGFRDCERGVQVVGVNNGAVTCELKTNRILNSFIGIDVLDNPSGPSGILYQNSITGGNNSVNGCGIRLLSTMGFGTSTLKIKENTITVNRNRMTGIQSSGVELLTMYDNHINIVTPTGLAFTDYKGIHLLNGANNNFLAENDIIGTTLSQWNNTSDDRNGIKVEGCMQTDIGCNNIISGVSSGLQILDDCSNSKIYKNKFSNCGVGLLYGKPYTYPGQSSPQYGKLNEWTGSFSKYPGWYSFDASNGYSTWILNSEFWAVPKPSIYHPLNITSEDPTDSWFFLNPRGGPDPCKTALIGEPGDDELSNKELDIINNGPGMYANDASHFWNTRWNLYNRLKRSPGLNTSNTINTYIINESNSNLGRLHASWSVLRNFQGLTSNEQNSYNTNHNSLLVQLNMLQTLYEQAESEYQVNGSVSSNTLVQISTATNTATTIANTLKTLGTINYSNWLLAKSNAHTILNTVTPANDIESYQKQIQAIFIATIASNQKPTNAQMTTIEQIANECPNLKAQGVWWARNLFKGFHAQDTSDFVKWCSLPQPIVSGNNNVQKSGAILMYPNPGSDELTIEGLSTEDDYRIIIYNSVGQLFKFEEGKASSKITLDTGSLPIGIYCVQVSQKGQVVSKTWIKN